MPKKLLEWKHDIDTTNLIIDDFRLDIPEDLIKEIKYERIWSFATLVFFAPASIILIYVGFDLFTAVGKESGQFTLSLLLMGLGGVGMYVSGLALRSILGKPGDLTTPEKAATLFYSGIMRHDPDWHIVAQIITPKGIKSIEKPYLVSMRMGWNNAIKTAQRMVMKNSGFTEYIESFLPDKPMMMGDWKFEVSKIKVNELSSNFVSIVTDVSLAWPVDKDKNDQPPPKATGIVQFHNLGVRSQEKWLLFSALPGQAVDTYDNVIKDDSK